MTNSILEITENEYLIKLNRKSFNLSFIRSLLKMVEVADPAQDGMMMPERRIVATTHSAEPEYFSSLDEK